MEIYLDLTIRKHLSSLFMITQMYILQVLVALKEMEIYLDLTLRKQLSSFFMITQMYVLQVLVA